MLKQQFQLAYYAKIDYTATEHMPSYERAFLYSQLVETKKQEEEEMKKAQKGVKKR